MIEYLIVGLGNPGKQYEKTRHNAGFMAVDFAAEKLGVKVNSRKFSALCAEAEIAGKRALIMKPETYMNLSGDAVSAAASFYKIPPEHIIVICDDINFDTGFMRIRKKGSHGGHNGLRDISAKLGSEDFIRIKLGVGKKPSPDCDLAEWVLGKMCPEALSKLSECFEKTLCSITEIIGGNIDSAMNKYSK